MILGSHPSGQSTTIAESSAGDLPYGASQYIIEIKETVMSERMKRDEVRRQLLDNACHISRIKEDEVRTWGAVLANGTDFVPGYIPFIGEKYFHRGTDGCRILAFAMSQNLNEKHSFAQAWAGDWARGGELALDRQNRAYADNQRVAMQPFDTGHIPVLAALLRSLVRERGPAGQENIYEQIAATNLSKFSFRTADGYTTDQPSSHQTCWEWFSKKEVNMLRPDYIICCGDLVYRIVTKEIVECCTVETAPKVLQVSFPSLQVINSGYGKKRWPKDLEPAQIEQCLTRGELDHPVKHKQNIHLRKIVARDAYYFMKMKERMRSQLSRC
jgi:hypothetical protein